jgi:hypothetical protein
MLPTSTTIGRKKNLTQNSVFLERQLFTQSTGTGTVPVLGYTVPVLRQIP